MAVDAQASVEGLHPRAQTGETRLLRIGASATGPTPQILADRFLQPFGKLTAAASYEQAVRPIHQARIAVEVLRRQVSATATARLDRDSRAASYRAILR